MKKTSIVILAIISLAFFFKVFEYYSSEINSKLVNDKRGNIKKLLEENTINLLTLENDTNNVIEFNNGYNMDNEKKRSFWNLLNK
tara:strand:- start:1218 stop:1472 length:255 start_codon:yes stop_codon:yes gene_type:complete